jgi:hypothetical protein
MIRIVPVSLLIATHPLRSMQPQRRAAQVYPAH